jgi:putative ABC transport system permease protein
VWFFLLLFLLISVTIISIASSQQVAYLNANVGNCVMMTKISEGVDGMEGPFYSKEADQIKRLPFVWDCNLVGFGSGNLVDAEPIVMDKEMYDLVIESAKAGGNAAPDTCSLFGLTSTQRYTLFTSAGFTLEEGRHITADDAGQRVAVISSPLAKENGLKLGDSIMVTNSNVDKQLSGDPGTLKLTIIGLFNYPQSSSLYNKDISPIFPGDMPANYVFIPSDTASAFSVYYSPLRLYVYLRGSEQIEDDIGRIKDEMGEGTTGTIYGPLIYTYTWDKQWISTVSKPAQEIRNMATAAAMGLGIGILVIILLIYALLLNGKKYEMGIYLSIGESKRKVVIQTVLEELVLVLAALALAAFMGILTAPGISSIVMEKPAMATNAAIEQQRDELIRYEDHAAYNIASDISSARTTYFYVNDRISVQDSFGVLIVYASGGIVVIILALTSQAVLFLRRSPAKLLLSN